MIKLCFIEEKINLVLRVSHLPAMPEGELRALGKTLGTSLEKISPQVT